MAKKFQKYQDPRRVMSAFDIIARTQKDPIFITPYKVSNDALAFIEFYAPKFTGEIVWEDRGLGHGRHNRMWTFRGFGRKAIDGSVAKLEYGPWVPIKGRFIEGQPGLDFEMKE